ncbi:MAG: ATP-binding protein [Deltaproteobacteria bacterium]|nr:ATP-binding protein [Deltaproteobacteria bacterium]
MFDTARESGCVLFIDEADGLLGVRLSQVQTASDASVNVTRAALLALMNDLTGTVVFATNKLSAYDPAFMRRMLAHILVDLPDAAAREALLRRMLPPQLPHRADVPALAALSEGLSGGDLGNVVLNAALHAAERGLTEVPQAALVDAVREVRDARERNLAPT